MAKNVKSKHFILYVKKMSGTSCLEGGGEIQARKISSLEHAETVYVVKAPDTVKSEPPCPFSFYSESNPSFSTQEMLFSMCITSCFIDMCVCMSWILPSINPSAGG